jgi:hypothetical protein
LTAGLVQTVGENAGLASALHGDDPWFYRLPYRVFFQERFRVGGRKRPTQA